MNKKKLIISLILKIVCIVSAITGTLLAFYWPEGYMVKWRTFLYFTEDSNILMTIVMYIGVIRIIKDFKGLDKKISDDTFCCLKHMFTVMMFFTMLTFYGMSIIGLFTESETDRAGIIHLMSIPSNWTVHLLAPITSIIDYLFFDARVKKENRRIINFLSLIFPLCYSIGTIMLSYAGVRFSHELAIVPYFFLDYEQYGYLSIGNGKIGIIYMWVVLALIIYFSNYLFYYLQGLIQKKVRLEKTP